MRQDYFIGCSGFHYDDWKEQFYPQKLAKSKWFEYYASQFNTVELNVTFYRTMKDAFFQGMYDRSPVDFRFSVKAPRWVTHYNRFVDVKEGLDAFYHQLKDGLKEKLGCVLFQLPPSVVYSEEFLERIILCLDRRFYNVVEFRNESWWNDSTIQRLHSENIVFSTVGYPCLPTGIITGLPIFYGRFHGSPKLYYSNYDSDFLASLAGKIKDSNASQVYVYFDNTAEGWAVHNAVELRQLLA